MSAGPGGRHSISGHHATVFGAYGMLGRAVTSQLASIGSVVKVPYRGPEYETRNLKLMGDNGRVQALPFSPRDDDSIRRAVKNSTVVVNCIGKV